jgi:hypothetical protein
MGRALNIMTVGGLLSIPSTNLEPRMDASAKVRTALSSGSVVPIPPTHTIATYNSGIHRQI